MEKWWLNSMLSKNKNKLKDSCRLNKLMGSLWDTSESKEHETEKNMLNWSESESDGESYSFSNIDFSLKMRGIWGLIYDDTFLVRDSNGDSYYVYFDIENKIFEINSDHFFIFISELESFFYRYLNSVSKPKNNTNLAYDYIEDTLCSWNNHINNCYLCFEINDYSYILSNTDNYSDSYIYSCICNQVIKSNGSHNFSIINTSNDSDFDLNINNGSDFDLTTNYSHLWVQCENCYGLNYKKFFKSKMNICEQCGYHLKMNSSDRIELLIDQDTWEPMDKNVVSMDPIEFHSEEEPYLDRILSYQINTGLNEAVETGIGQINGIPIAMAVMDFQFMGGSMGSVVGEKITRLIEFATNRSLPVIIVCASGGARMQEGSLSLMQMAKISSASYDYQLNKKLFYVAILASPTTGGVTASFGMLGDVIIAEPNAYIAFAGKRVIEETLNTIVPEGSQESEYLFDKGLFDLIVPRNLLKGVLSELFQLHGFFTLNPNNKKKK